MKIIIAGLSKSGTTALFYAVKSAMPHDTHCLFEPFGFDGADGSTHVLAKVLVREPGMVDYASFDAFDKKIVIIRDPRDNVVSRVLYDVYNVPRLCRNEAKMDALVGLFRRKEADPQSVPLIQIMDLIDNLTKRRLRFRSATVFDLILDFQRSHAEYFTYRYEVFVRGDFAALEPYLGLSLATGPDIVPADLSRVTRTRSSGDWRHWMTPEDVQYFRPYLAEFMRFNGYDDDWTLAAAPTILPEHASDYVLRVAAEARDLP